MKQILFTFSLLILACSCTESESILTLDKIVESNTKVEVRKNKPFIASDDWYLINPEKYVLIISAPYSKYDYLTWNFYSDSLSVLDSIATFKVDSFKLSYKKLLKEINHEEEKIKSITKKHN